MVRFWHNCYFSFWYCSWKKIDACRLWYSYIM